MKTSYQNDCDFSDITYGSIELWSRKRILECTTELRITCNQIVEQQDINSDSNLTHKSNYTLIDNLCWVRLIKLPMVFLYVSNIIQLSMVMPYAVLKRLVLGCLENKGQTTAVHSILQNLGGLCSLKAHADEEPLLINVLNSQEVAQCVSSLPSGRNYTDLICQWTMVSYTAEYADL
jgi:hypothetical protein